MALVQRTINQCDVCGYEWIPRSAGERCGNRKCRSTKWNDKHANPVQRTPKPDIQRLRDICAGKTEPATKDEFAIGYISAAVDGRLMQSEPQPMTLHDWQPMAVQLCPKTGYNEQDGETYRCRLVKGHKGNCQAGAKV